MARGRARRPRWRYCYCHCSVCRRNRRHDGPGSKWGAPLLVTVPLPRSSSRIRTEEGPKVSRRDEKFATFQNREGLGGVSPRND